MKATPTPKKSMDIPATVPTVMLPPYSIEGVQAFSTFVGLLPLSLVLPDGVCSWFSVADLHAQQDELANDFLILIIFVVRVGFISTALAAISGVFYRGRHLVPPNGILCWVYRSGTTGSVSKHTLFLHRC